MRVVLFTLTAVMTFTKRSTLASLKCLLTSRPKHSYSTVKFDLYMIDSKEEDMLELNEIVSKEKVSLEENIYI